MGTLQIPINGVGLGPWVIGLGLNCLLGSNFGCSSFPFVFVFSRTASDLDRRRRRARPCKIIGKIRRSFSAATSPWRLLHSPISLLRRRWPSTVQSRSSSAVPSFPSLPLVQELHVVDTFYLPPPKIRQWTIFPRSSEAKILKMAVSFRYRIVWPKIIQSSWSGLFDSFRFLMQLIELLITWKISLRLAFCFRGFLMICGGCFGL